HGVPTVVCFRLSTGPGRRPPRRAFRPERKRDDTTRRGGYRSFLRDFLAGHHPGPCRRTSLNATGANFFLIFVRHNLNPVISEVAVSNSALRRPAGTPPDRRLEARRD